MGTKNSKKKYRKNRSFTLLFNYNKQNNTAALKTHKCVNITLLSAGVKKLYEVKRLMSTVKLSHSTTTKHTHTHIIYLANSF